MRDAAFSFERMSKRFGRVEALKDVSLEAPRGSVIGLLGRNGAGKSTAIRCLVGLQRPSSGRASLLGVDSWDLPVPVKQRMGYLSDQVLPFPRATAEDLIGFCGRLYPRWDDDLARDILLRFGIHSRRKLRDLSLGQQRTVGLLLALCPRPEVLVLDEPAANLDPVVRREFLDQVLELVAEEGRTVLLSSHILSDVERVADRIALLHEGNLLLYRETDEIKERTRRLRFIFPADPPLRLGVPGVVCERRAGREVLITTEAFRDDLPARLAAETGAQVEVQPIGLEELFIDMVGDRDQSRAAA